MESHVTWDATWFGVCDLMAARSKDPNTKVGCVIVRDNRQLTSGYNGLPRGVADAAHRLTRPEKYDWVEHAERNAIYNAAYDGVRVADATLYCQYTPCVACARAIIQSGIVEVRYLWNLSSRSEQYAKDWELTEAMFSERGVKLLECNLQLPQLAL